MKYKKLGNMEVSVIGQGTQGISSPDNIRFAIDQGMTFIDTAEVYGNEEVVGDAIKGIRGKVQVSTKFSPEHNGYSDVIEACEGSLKRLNTDYIDLYSLHWPTSVPLEDTINALFKLVTDGKVKNIGVCNLSFNQLKSLQDVMPESIQLEYNLFDRSVESEILPYCEENNITLIAYSPLMGFHHWNPDAMIWVKEIAVNHNMTISQVILNWLVSHRPVIAIPKSRSGQHIIENANAAEIDLSADLEKIDKLFPYEVAYIDPKEIHVSKVGRYPQTLKEAEENIWGFSPSPLELAEDLEDIKPIRIEHRREGYELVEGGLRYWAWVIKNGDKPIPSLVRYDIFHEHEVYNPKPEVKCEIHPEAPLIDINKKKYCSQCYNEFIIGNVNPLEG